MMDSKSYEDYPDVVYFHKAEAIYKRVLEIFHFDQSKDKFARDLLYEIRKTYDPSVIIRTIKTKLESKQPIFFGAGPNLIKELKEIKKKDIKKDIKKEIKKEKKDIKKEIKKDIKKDINNNRDRYIIIAADGAANALTVYNITPDLIFSDLDGLTINQFKKFLDDNVVVFVHAHGDNIDKLREFKNLLSKYDNIIGTTQYKEKYPIINPGGFTDGDRGIFFCHHLSPISSKFILLGYEFGDRIGKFSKPNYSKSKKITVLKKKKLNLCKELLENLRKVEKRAIILYK